jgi:hypothetical protein
MPNSTIGYKLQRQDFEIKKGLRKWGNKFYCKMLLLVYWLLNFLLCPYFIATKSAKFSRDLKFCAYIHITESICVVSWFLNLL